MTKQIRKSAPAGATHYAIIKGEVFYFMVNGEMCQRHCSVGWVNCFKPSRLYRLYAPWWVEPVIMLIVMAVAAGFLVGNYLGWL